MIDKFISAVRRLAFKVFREGTFFGKVCDKLITKEMFLYLFFGVLTTVVNFIAYALFQRIFSVAGWQGTLATFFEGRGWQSAVEAAGKETQYLDSTIIAWAISVIFAFITNKIWVFESKSFAPATAVREFISFVGARIFSLFAELLCMFLLVSVAGINDIVAKIIVAVIVVVLNYIFSKLFVFRKEDIKNE